MKKIGARRLRLADFVAEPGKIGGKKEKLTKMAHKLLGKVSQEKKDQTIVDLATKKQAMIIEKVSAVAAKKGIGVQICDISVRKI